MAVDFGLFRRRGSGCAGAVGHYYTIVIKESIIYKPNLLNGFNHLTGFFLMHNETA
jgi:hypothetical protein